MINNVPVKRVPFHKHLGLKLDSKLDFNEHINVVLSEVYKNGFASKLSTYFTTALPFNDI